MKSFIIISAYPNTFYNDWETLEYFKDIEIIGVHKSLEEALSFISSREEPCIGEVKGQIYGKGLDLGKCWNIGHYYIVKR